MSGANKTIVDDLTTQIGELEFEVPGTGDCSLYCAVKGLLLQCMINQSSKEQIQGTFLNIHEKYKSSVESDRKYVNHEKPDRFNEFISDLLELEPKKPSSVKAFAQKYFEKNTKDKDITDGDKVLASLVGCLRKACSYECSLICTSLSTDDLWPYIDVNQGESAISAKTRLQQQFKPFESMDARWINMVLPEALRFDTQKTAQEIVTATGKTFDFSKQNSPLSDIIISEQVSASGNHFVLKISNHFAEALKKSSGLVSSTPTPPNRPSTQPPESLTNNNSRTHMTQWNNYAREHNEIEHLTSELLNSFAEQNPNISKIRQDWDALKEIKGIQEKLGADLYHALETGHNDAIAKYRTGKNPGPM